MTTARRANVAGLGLIGGSIALALRERGWHVTGDDLDPARVERALALGAIDASGFNRTAAVTFVATPVLVSPRWDVSGGSSSDSAEVGGRQWGNCLASVDVACCCG